MNKNHAIAALAALAIFNEVAAEYNRWVIKKQNAKITKLAGISKYLVEVIDRNEVPLTQFDKIAIETIIGD